MIRLCSATHQSEKALRLFNDLESTGYIEHAITYNAIIFSLASTYRYAPLAIDYWRKMQLNNVLPDQHTLVGVLKACAKIGDVNTAV